MTDCGRRSLNTWNAWERSGAKEAGKMVYGEMLQMGDGRWRDKWGDVRDFRQDIRHSRDEIGDVR